MGGEEGGGVDRRGRGRLPFLPEEVEARAVLPLGTGNADAGHRNPGPPDAAVGGHYKSDGYTYSQVHEYSSFHFYARCLAMRLSVASALTPRSPSTELVKGVQCVRSFKQSLRFFLFFLLSAVSRHFSFFCKGRRRREYSQHTCCEYCLYPDSKDPGSAGTHSLSPPNEVLPPCLSLLPCLWPPSPTWSNL